MAKTAAALKCGASFTKQFKYLGSLIADKLTDDAECNAHIFAASQAFGALKTQLLFGVWHIRTRAKKFLVVYQNVKAVTRKSSRKGKVWYKQ
jgi:hypothetical protein